MAPSAAVGVALSGGWLNRWIAQMNNSQLYVIHGPEEEAIRPVLEGIESYGIEAIGGRAPARGGVAQVLRGRGHRWRRWS